MTTHDVIDYRGQPGSHTMPIPMSASQIADDLAERIRHGEYPPGTKLPSYRELGDLYSVSFSTMAKVVWMLRERGLVVGVPGRGVFVPEDVIGP